MTETKLREAICRTATSMFDRGLTHGSTGNISARLDRDGRHVGGDPPTKEAFLHLAMYRQRPGDGAVVHLHATHSVAVSVLADVEARDVLPPLTAYYVMRVGRLPLVPYHPPGDPALAGAVAKLTGECHALLLANHGPVVSGATLAAASDAIEELEATARVFLLTCRQPVRPLTPGEVRELRERLGRE